MDFEKQIAAFAKKANESIDETIRGVTIKLFSAVILSTPVKTGRARANWQISNEKPANGTVDGLDYSGGSTVNYMSEFVAQDADGRVFTLTNNLPYVYRLEYGWSKTQAPSGMVRVNVSRFESILEEQARLNK